MRYIHHVVLPSPSLSHWMPSPEKDIFYLPILHIFTIFGEKINYSQYAAPYYYRIYSYCQPEPLCTLTSISPSQTVVITTPLLYEFNLLYSTYY
jgi:hypothetical protein